MLRLIARETRRPSRFTARKREHSIGTSVSATNIEITIATASEIANSRNSRPVLPVISESGTSTATSDAVVAITGKPTSREPLSAAAQPPLAELLAPVDVLQHHDRVVDHQPDREHEREQREHVDREVEHGERGEGADHAPPGSPRS